MTRHERMLEELYVLAQDMEMVGNARVTAAITCRNRIVSYGMAKHKTHPLQAQFARHENALCLHAEIDAIANAIRRHRGDISFLSSCVLYVARAKLLANPQNTGVLEWSRGLAKPCEGCQEALEYYRIPSVKYTTEIN